MCWKYTVLSLKIYGLRKFYESRWGQFQIRVRVSSELGLRWGPYIFGPRPYIFKDRLFYYLIQFEQRTVKVRTVWTVGTVRTTRTPNRPNSSLWANSPNTEQSGHRKVRTPNSSNIEQSEHHNSEKIWTGRTDRTPTVRTLMDPALNNFINRWSCFTKKLKDMNFLSCCCATNML